MRGIHGIAGLAVLGTALASWATFALAQSGVTKLPPTQNGPASIGSKPASPTPGYGSGPSFGSSTPLNIPGGSGSGITSDRPNNLTGISPVGPAGSAIKTTSGAATGLGNGGYSVPAQTPAAEEGDSGPGQSNENPTGRQEPAVSLEWIGPPLAKVGRPADYTVAVRNACNIAVQQVIVRVRVPAGMNIAATEPKAITEGNVVLWEIGTMTPKQERNLQLRLLPDGRGNMGCQAWVTFTGSSAMKIKVCEPKLTLKAQAPEKVMVGDAATFVLTVTNPGDGPADQVKIHATLSEGLEHPRGKNVDFEVGNLAPGETRSVQLICATKSGGEQKCEGVAEADGDLKAQDRASVNVIMPRLELEANGPKLRYLDRKAVYTFKVTNPGDASATNVSVSDLVPAGFKFVSASDGGRNDFSTRTVSWFLGEIGPAQSKEVKMELVAVNPGEYHHKATAVAARGLKVEGEVMTRVEGLSAILLEVVDTEDPIEVGADTSYEIRITNTGSKTETDIKLACIIPDKMQFKTAQGPSRFHEQGKEIIFDSLPKLAPRADAIFRITVKGIAAGDVRFKTQITSTNLQEPVIEQEATRIYED